MADSPYSTPHTRASYGVGLQLGDQLRANPFEGMDIEAVCAGLIDSFAGRESAVERADLEAAFGVIRAQMEKQGAEKAETVGAEGIAFLAKNAERDEVHVTDSGLQYEILTMGEGDLPKASSVVRTHYHGTLINGEVFDSSVQRNEPAEFPVNGVIAGWTEALQIMPVGSKWKLFIPQDLAYGERGAGGTIGPFAALVFEIELLAIVS